MSYNQSPPKSPPKQPPLKQFEVVIDSVSPVKKDPDEWILSPHLFMTDKAAILNKQCLSCRIMDAGQEMLRKATMATPKIDGWQSIQLGANYRFKEIRGEFIQIMHVRQNHWITVSNIRCATDTVCVYDSHYQSVDIDTQMQICSFLRSTSDTVTFVMANMQSQNNSFDCGVYAIATATELAHKRDPCICHWDPSTFRLHLVDCLQKGKLSPFPIVKRRRVPLGKRFTGKPTILDIYCTCRMPDRKDVPMVECSGCSSWFHFACVQLEVSDQNNINDMEWLCESCLANKKALADVC